MNNLKQLGLAVQMYTTEHEGFYPVSVGTGGTLTADGMVPAVGYVGCLWPYAEGVKSFLCPSCKDKSILINYVYNFHAGSDYVTDAGVYYTGGVLLKGTRVKSPVKFILLYDSAVVRGGPSDTDPSDEWGYGSSGEADQTGGDGHGTCFLWYWYSKKSQRSP